MGEKSIPNTSRERNGDGTACHAKKYPEGEKTFYVTQVQVRQPCTVDLCNKKAKEITGMNS